MSLQSGLQDIWSSDYVQKNPNKAYKASYASEYAAVAAYLNGGAEPNFSGYSKLGKGLCEIEKERRAAEVPVPPEPVPPEPTPSEPPSIAGRGYKVVFEDDFDTLDTTIWRKSTWYEPEDDGSDVYASNSILSLVSRQSEGYPYRLAMLRHGSGQNTFKFGYFEARMRFTDHPSSFPAWWMMSSNWMDTGNCTTLKVSEFDMMEEFPHVYPNGFSGVLHRNTSNPCGMANASKIHQPGNVGFKTYGDWHTWAGLWTSTNVHWYCDDVLLASDTVWDTTNQPMRPLLQIGSHKQGGEPAVLQADIDWVRIWQDSSGTRT